MMVAPPGFTEGDDIPADIILAEVACPICGAETALLHRIDGNIHRLLYYCPDLHHWMWESLPCGLMRCMRAEEIEGEAA